MLSIIFLIAVFKLIELHWKNESNRFADVLTYSIAISMLGTFTGILISYFFYLYLGGLLLSLTYPIVKKFGLSGKTLLYYLIILPALIKALSMLMNWPGFIVFLIIEPLPVIIYIWIFISFRNRFIPESGFLGLIAISQLMIIIGQFLR